MFLSEWCELPSATCLAGKEPWWQLASRASLTCFRACFLLGRAKDLSALQYFVPISRLQEFTKQRIDLRFGYTRFYLNPKLPENESGNKKLVYVFEC